MCAQAGDKYFDMIDISHNQIKEVDFDMRGNSNCLSNGFHNSSSTLKIRDLHFDFNRIQKGSVSVRLMKKYA